MKWSNLGAFHQAAKCFASVLSMKPEASELHVYAVHGRIEVQSVVGPNEWPCCRDPSLRCCVVLRLRQNTAARKIGLVNGKNLPSPDLLFVGYYSIVDGPLKCRYSLLGVDKTFGRLSCAGPTNPALPDTIFDPRSKPSF